MDPEKKNNFIFRTEYVIPKSLKFSHWPSKFVYWAEFKKNVTRMAVEIHHKGGC